METFVPFVINVAGLKDGTYTYEFVAEKALFTHYGYTEFNSKARFLIKGQLEKKLDVGRFKFAFKGRFDVVCDRCAEPFVFEVRGKDALPIRFHTELKEEDFKHDEVMNVLRTAHELDLSKYVYDSIVLSIPNRKVHLDNEDGSSGCNPKVMAILQQSEEAQTPKENPIWSALKNLKSDDSSN